jgi:hypothetical protein
MKKRKGRKEGRKEGGKEGRKERRGQHKERKKGEKKEEKEYEKIVMLIFWTVAIILTMNMHVKLSPSSQVIVAGRL